MSAEIFWRLHEGLPQQGPGSDATTLRALRALGPLVPSPRIIDLGCGPGRQSIALAAETGGEVTAIDRLPPFLGELAMRAEAAGLAGRIHPVQADMGALDSLPDGSFDVLWSEGAIYHLGFEAGLRSWRRLLAPGGLAAVSEISWLVPDPAAEALAFWAEAYPGMASRETNRERAGRAGYRRIGDFALPKEDWLADYYDRIAERIGPLREERGHEPEVARALDEAEREHTLFLRHHESYGYVFYLLAADGG